MDPITWSMVAGLLLKYGPQVADFVVERYHAGNEVTVEDWKKLQALAEQTPAQQLNDAFTRNGIDPNSEEAKALIAKLPPQG